MAVAAVWSTILRQPLIFPRKNTQCGLWWGPYERSLREDTGAPPGANIVENVTFSAPGVFGRAGGLPDVLPGWSEATF